MIKYRGATQLSDILPTGAKTNTMLHCLAMVCRLRLLQYIPIPTDVQGPDGYIAEGVRQKDRSPWKHAQQRISMQGSHEMKQVFVWGFHCGVLDTTHLDARPIIHEFRSSEIQMSEDSAQFLLFSAIRITHHMFSLEKPFWQ